MSNENEQFAYTWDDEEESESPSDSSYPDSHQPRSAPPGSDPARRAPQPQRRVRPRGVPGSADFYEVSDDDEQARPRRVRQSREEVEARLRQRNRQTRNQGEIRPRPQGQQYSQTPRPTQRGARETGSVYQSEPLRQARPTRDFASDSSRPTRDFSAVNRPSRAPEPYDAHDEYNAHPEQEEHSYQPEHRHRHHHRHEKRRRVFSTVFTGCLGGVITLLVVAAILVFLILHNTPVGQNLGVTKTTVNQPPQTQTLALDNATQLIVKNQVGNISVNVDQNATTATLTSVKHVQASSQSDANTQFKGIILSIKPLVQSADPACLVSSCLSISATVPTNTSSGGLFGGGNGDSIDLAITLPPGFNSPDPGVPDIITASADAGNINVSSFNGVLNLNGNAGNITIAHTLLFASTCIQTLHGNISIAQQSIFDLTSASPRVPCNNTTSTDATRPWFNIKSGVGNLDITLTTNLNNLLLDANTNDGKITDDFNLALTSSNGSYSYHGPIMPNTNPTASLYVATSTGDIALHKA